MASKITLVCKKLFCPAIILKCKLAFQSKSQVFRVENARALHTVVRSIMHTNCK